MQAEDLSFEGFEALGGGFNEEQVFARMLELALPEVERFHRCGKDVDACGEMFLDDSAGDFAGLGKGAAGDQHDAEWRGAWHGKPSLRLIVYEEAVGDTARRVREEEKANEGRREAVEGSTRARRIPVFVSTLVAEDSVLETDRTIAIHQYE